MLGLWRRGQTLYSRVAREKRQDPNAEDTDTARGCGVLSHPQQDPQETATKGRYFRSRDRDPRCQDQGTGEVERTEGTRERENLEG